jgi:riboflavin transporter FmnP
MTRKQLDEQKNLVNSFKSQSDTFASTEFTIPSLIKLFLIGAAAGAILAAAASYLVFKGSGNEAAAAIIAAIISGICTIIGALIQGKRKI